MIAVTMIYGLLLERGARARRVKPCPYMSTLRNHLIVCTYIVPAHSVVGAQPCLDMMPLGSAEH